MTTRRPPPPPPPPPLPLTKDDVVGDDTIDGDDDDSALAMGPEIKVTTPEEAGGRPPPPPPYRSSVSSSQQPLSPLLRRNEPVLLRASQSSGLSDTTADDLESSTRGGSSAGAGHVDDDEVVARLAASAAASTNHRGGMGSPRLFSSPRGSASGRARVSLSGGGARGMLLVPDGTKSPSALSTSQRSSVGSLSIDIAEDAATEDENGGGGGARSGKGNGGGSLLAHRPVGRSSLRQSRSKSPTSLLRGRRSPSLLLRGGSSAGASSSSAAAAASEATSSSRAVSIGSDEANDAASSSPLTPSSGPVRSRSATFVTPPGGLKSSTPTAILRRTSSAVASRSVLRSSGSKKNTSLLPLVSPHALVKKSPSDGSMKGGMGMIVKRPAKVRNALTARSRGETLPYTRSRKANNGAVCRGCSSKNCPAKKRRSGYRRITHTVKLCFGNDLLSLGLHVFAFLAVLTVTLRAKWDVDRATRQLEHYREEERRVNDKIHEFETRAARLTGEVERLRMDNDRMERIKKDEEEKIRRRKEEEKMTKRMEEERKELSKRDAAVREQVKVLEERIRVESRREAEEKFGPGPHRVEIALDFPSSQPTVDDGGRELPYKFHVELADLAAMPHSVHLFLEQVSRGLWDDCAFVWNPSHLILASPHVHRRGGDGSDGDPNELVSDDVRREKFRDVGFDRVSFQEYSPEYPHRQYTLGLAGRPGGPNFYINVKDNAKIHGPRAASGDDDDGDYDDNDEEKDADPCFGKVVAGFDAVDRMHAVRTHGENAGEGEEVSGWQKDAFVNDVVIRYAKLLPGGSRGGKIKPTGAGGGSKIKPTGATKRYS